MIAALALPLSSLAGHENIRDLTEKVKEHIGIVYAIGGRPC
jgi:hypothetical protein